METVGVGFPLTCRQRSCMPTDALEQLSPRECEWAAAGQCANSTGSLPLACTRKSCVSAAPCSLVHSLAALW